MKAARKALLEKRGAWDVGRNPRQVSREELIAAVHKPMSPLKALRTQLTVEDFQVPTTTSVETVR